MIYNALTIAGSDSGGGAGVQADLKTFSALGVYGACVVTALTAQNTREVRAIHDPPAAFVADQIDAVFEDIRIDAVKIGMLSRPAVIEAVARGLERHAARHIVLDPVMVAKSGDKLLGDDAVRVLAECLVPLASIITPNLPEAAVLLGTPEPVSEVDMEEAAARLVALGAPFVLLKGGHLGGALSVDMLHDGARCQRLQAARVATGNTHGTGCTLSSAIAAHLARGQDMAAAVRAAKRYVSEALAHADDLDVGTGHGPVQHFFAAWPAADTRAGREHG